MSEQQFQPGEIVRVTIEGRVVSVMPKTDQIAIEHDHVQGLVVVDASHLPVERVAPAEWPPQLNDLWREAKGRTWWAIEAYFNDSTKAEVVLMNRDAYWLPVGNVLRTHGPLTLVHREQQDGGEPRE